MFFHFLPLAFPALLFLSVLLHLSVSDPSFGTKGLHEFSPKAFPKWYFLRNGYNWYRNDFRAIGHYLWVIWGLCSFSK